MKRPRLGVALLQILVQRTIDCTHRIESFSVDNIERRLARSLIRFSERLGTDEGDGSVRMMPFTHEVLSQCVGTSREIVTHYVTQFRRQGYIRYSRKGIIVYRDAFREWLRREAESSRSDVALARSTEGLFRHVVRQSARENLASTSSMPNRSPSIPAPTA